METTLSIEELQRENAELKAANLELQTANLELQTQVKLMRTIFDSLSEGVVASSLEGEFLVVNPVSQEIAGMGPTEGEPEEWSETYGTFHPDKLFAAGFTTKENGNGLGLHFVISSGGNIQSFSESIGKGATIRVMLRNAANHSHNHRHPTQAP